MGASRNFRGVLGVELPGPDTLEIIRTTQVDPTAAHGPFTVEAVRKIVNECVRDTKPRPNDTALAAFVDTLNRDTARTWVGARIGWSLCAALGTISRELPEALESLHAGSSIRVGQIKAELSRLQETVRQIQALGFSFPGPGAKPPKKNPQANSDHPLMQALFDDTKRLLLESGWTSVGSGHNSPAILITVALLKVLKINCNEYLLSKMLSRLKNRFQE
jgi:hypothetical protein